MRKLLVPLAFIFLACIAAFCAIKSAITPHDGIRIYWRHGTEHHSQDLPIEGRVYWIFTHRGVFYFDDTQGEVFTLTNWNNICPEDQELVKRNLKELASKWK